MADYLNAIEWGESGDDRSERSSNASVISFDSASSQKSFEESYLQNLENKKREDELIEQKYDLIKDINKGKIDIDVYWFKMSNINKKLA